MLGETAKFGTDLYYASGTFTVTTFCDVTLYKNMKGKTTVKGTMLNIWWDPYDWHSGLTAFVPGFGVVSDDDANFLIAQGRAKDFYMRSNWSINYEKEL